MRNPFSKKNKERIRMDVEGEFPSSATAKDKVDNLKKIIAEHGGEIISSEIIAECNACGFKMEIKEENFNDFKYCPKCGKFGI